MSNYTKTTNFATKDSLPSGDPNKIVKGAEINTEFDNIATAVSTKSNSESPTFTGTVTIPTADINGGAIDGTVIGGTTAASITGTTLTANTSLNIAGDGATVTGIKDEDDMASNSATKLATQQSIKAYVDSQVTAQDLDVTTDSGTISIDLDSETLTVAGGTGLDSSATGNTVTLGIDSTVATLTGTQTLTNKTLTAPVISGNLTTDGTIDGRDVATDGTKLDGIEANATADQTAAEIRTLVESATDSNVFTDADHSKLDGIEANADVTDTTNVVSALTAGTNITIAANGTISATDTNDDVSTATPTLSSSAPNSITVTNMSSYINPEFLVKQGSDVLTYTVSGSTITITGGTTNTGSQTVSVEAQDFGRVGSTAATVSVTLVTAYRYYRLTGMTKVGTNPFLTRYQLFSGANLTSPIGTASTSGYSGFSISASYAGYTSTYSPNKAGNTSTSSGWWTLGLATSNIPSQWITIDAQSSQVVQSVLIGWYTATDNYHSSTATIQGSNDNSNWTTIKTVTGMTSKSQNTVNLWT